MDQFDTEKCLLRDQMQLLFLQKICSRGGKKYSVFYYCDEISSDFIGYR